MSQQNAPRRANRLVLALAALALAVPMAAAPEAEAFPDAKVESQTRPNFGMLLDPPLQRRSRTRHRRWSWRDHHRDWRPDFDHRRERFSDEVALVDCGDRDRPFALAHAVARLRPGGTLVLRARGGPCVGWIDIDKPLTIIGEAGVSIDGFTPEQPATLRAPAGQPCVTVAPGVRVEIRDVVFESLAAGDAACLVGYEAHIVLNRTAFRHAGDEAAIFTDGGSLDIRNSLVDADTIVAGIVGYGSVVAAYDVTVSRAAVGIELTPEGTQPSRLHDVALVAPSGATAFGPRTLGLVVRGARDLGRVEVTGAVICGYSEGLSVEGGTYVEVRDSNICGARKGAVLYNGELNVEGSQIGASDYGVVLGAGRAAIRGNEFYGVNQVIVRDGPVSLAAEGNRVFSSTELCRPERVPRGRRRGQYDWRERGGEGWSCSYGPGSRDFWEECERRLGVDYRDYAHPWPDYDRYRQHGGWYDEGGRYFQDDRRR